MSLVERPISLLLFEKSGAVAALRDLLKFYETSDVPLRLDANNAQHQILIPFLEDVIQFSFPITDSAIGIDPEKRRLNMYYRLFGMTINGRQDFPIAGNYNNRFVEDFENILQQIQVGILDASGNMQYTGRADPAALADSLNEFRDNLVRYYYANNTLITIRQSYQRFLRLVSLLEPPPPGTAPGDYSQILMTALNIQSDQLDARIHELGRIVNEERQKLGQNPLDVSPIVRLHLILGEDMGGVLDTVMANNNWDPAAASQLYTPPPQRDLFRRIMNNWKKIVNSSFEVEGMNNNRNVVAATTPTTP